MNNFCFTVFYQHSFSAWTLKMIVSKLAGGLSFWLIHHYFGAAIVVTIILFIALYFVFRRS